MQLIGALASGIRGAESGSATLRRRGTSSPATYYTTFEADSQVTSGSVALDQNGGASVYVNEPVDVVVLDENGATVRSFTEGCAATAVEVISPSFTGTDYESGATGVSNPVSLSTVMALWIASTGAADWKVLVGGVATTLSNAIGRGAGIFYNVKSPEYGGLADGVSNDSAAINAASAAAGQSGTLVFPAGSYIVGTPLVGVSGQTWLLMPGATLKPSGLAAAMIAVTTGDTDKPFTIEGGAIEPVGTHGFDIVRATSRDVTIKNCEIGSLITGNIVTASSGSTARLSNCTLTVTGAASCIVGDFGAGQPYLYVDDCVSTLSGSAVHTDALFKVLGGRFSSSQISIGASVTGTFGLLETGALVRGLEISNNVFSHVGGAAVLTAVDAALFVSPTTVKLSLSGNEYVGITTKLSLDQTSDTIYTDGDRATASISTTATTATILVQDVRAQLYIRGGAAGNFDISSSGLSGCPRGASLRIVVFNNTAGAVNVGLDAGIISDYPTTGRQVLAAGEYFSVELVKFSQWYQLSAAAVWA